MAKRDGDVLPLTSETRFCYAGLTCSHTTMPGEVNRR